MKLIFDGQDFDGQLRRSVSKDNFGMANAGECLAIAAKISASDASGWYPAFAGFAKTLQGIAERAFDGGHRVSAREGYLRACEYYRNVFFYERSRQSEAAYRLRRPSSVFPRRPTAVGVSIYRTAAARYSVV
jgi:hypothetical protein